MEQRRRHQRVPIAFPLKLRIGDINSFTEEFCTDLSEGGIFVRMNYPPPVGTVVTLDFHLESVGKSINAKGEVVRSVPEGKAGGGVAGMGVQFTDLGKDGRRFIELVVQKFNRQHPSQHIELPANFLEDVDAELATQGMRAPGEPGLKIRIKHGTIESFVEEQGEYLKDGEVFIRTDKPRARGTPVELTVLLEKQNKMLTGSGTVIWSRSAQDEDGKARRPGMSVKITDPNEEMRQVLGAVAAIA